MISTSAPNESKSDPIFLKYAIDQLKPRLRRVTKGTTQDNLSVEKLIAFKFPAPAIEEQKKIGSVLCAYGDLMENNRRQLCRNHEPGNGTTGAIADG